MNVEPEIQSAIQQFAAKISVPVLFDNPPSSIGHLGTGTLFECKEGHFLVTARHIFDDVELAHVAIPEQPRGPKVITLGSFERIQPKDPAEMDIDVVVLKLRDDSVIRTLKHGWEFLTLDNVATASSTGTFVLCGYPTSGMRYRGESLGGTLLTCYTERLTEIPLQAKPPIDEEIDIFLNYEGNATNIKGELIEKIPLYGMSGCSVWEYRPSTDTTVWTPAAALRVVGIQASYLKNDFARAKAWTFVETLIRNS